MNSLLHFSSIQWIVYFEDLKRPVKTDQTCWSNIQHCWVVLDGVWSVFMDCVGCWIAQTNSTPSNNVGFQYQAWHYAVSLIMRTKILDNVGWKVWTKSNFIQHHPTLSSMFNCAVQTGQTCFVQQCLIMFDQRVWSVWTDLYAFLDKRYKLSKCEGPRIILFRSKCKCNFEAAVNKQCWILIF